MNLHPLGSTVSNALRTLSRAALVPALLLACSAGNDTRPPDVPQVPEAADTSEITAPAPGSGEQAEVTPDAPPPSGAEFVAGVLDVDRAVTGAALLRDVRTARHEGFDRIVLEFGDTGVPGYHIEYIDRPVRQCGSGDVVPLAGDAWLQVRVEPANAHTDAGQPTIRERARRPGLPNLLELKMVCDFEAQVEWVGGVATPARFRAFVLRAPDRLVVDVRHR